MNLREMIVRQKTVLLMDIEYPLCPNGRADLMDELDKTYGKLRWRSRRSGPISSKSNTGLMVVEVDCD